MEISKNRIILILSILCTLMGVYITCDVLKHPELKESIAEDFKTVPHPDINKQATEALKSANETFLRAEGVINKLSDKIKEVVEENAVLHESNDYLKEKLDYYYEYYNRNQPVGIEVAEDTPKIITQAPFFIYYIQ